MGRRRRKTPVDAGGHDRCESGLAIGPDGKLFAAGGVDETIHVFDATSGQAISVLRGHLGPVNALAFRPDGMVLASASADRTARTWEVASGNRIGTYQADMALAGIAWARDGRRLAAVGGRWSQAYFESDSPGEVRIWDRNRAAPPRDRIFRRPHRQNRLSRRRAAWWHSRTMVP